ncbi:ABC transporter permease [Clostridium chrysemydis]|uniref:ABC transporter permease n=1 Tax=Clostridium chrysemydis TaxID=2665504 RepID=UPI003F313BB8
MKEFKTLKFLDKLKGFYEKAGVDYSVLRLILQTKLTMDSRRNPTIMANSKPSKNKDGNKLTGTLLFYAFFGIIIGFFMFIPGNVLFKMTFIFGAFMFVIGSSFISDFSSVLLDVRDKNILGTKAISSKTINAAKITHVCIYIIQLTFAFCGFSILFSLKYGPIFTLIFIIEIFLVDIFMILFTSFIYFLILKFFNGEKLKDIINMIQIILTVLIIFGYQIIGRLYDIVDSTITLTDKFYAYFVPPVWFAAPLEIISSKEVNKPLVIFSILSIIVPLLSIIIYTKISEPFEEYIQKLNNNTYISNGKIPFSFKFSKFICRDEFERSFFNFTVNLIKGERTFKLKTYPALAIAVLLPFLFLFMDFTSYSSFSEFKASLLNSNTYLFIYFTVAALSTTCLMAKYSDNYKATWVFKSTPIKNTSTIYKGVFKGTFYKLVLPPIIILLIIFGIAFGVSVFIKLIPALLSLILISLIAFKFMGNYLPFSVEFKENNEGDIASTIMSFILSGIFAGINYGFIYIPYGIYILIAIELLLTIIFYKLLFKNKVVYKS